MSRKQICWTPDMEFLLLGSVYGHKAHLKASDDVWNAVSAELDLHYFFHKGSQEYTPLKGTTKAS